MIGAAKEALPRNERREIDFIDLYHTHHNAKGKLVTIIFSDFYNSSSHQSFPQVRHHQLYHETQEA